MFGESQSLGTVDKKYNQRERKKTGYKVNNTTKIQNELGKNSLQGTASIMDMQGHLSTLSNKKYV